MHTALFDVYSVSPSLPTHDRVCEHNLNCIYEILTKKAATATIITKYHSDFSACMVEFTNHAHVFTYYSAF